MKAREMLPKPKIRFQQGNQHEIIRRLNDEFQFL